MKEKAPKNIHLELDILYRLLRKADATKGYMGWVEGVIKPGFKTTRKDKILRITLQLIHKPNRPTNKLKQTK